MDALVIGTTTEQEVHVASRTGAFAVNSLLLIDAPADSSVGIVVAAQSFNRFLPDARGGSGPVDTAALEALRQLGWDAEGETVHLASVRLLDARTRPVRVGAWVTVPDFATVAPYYLPPPSVHPRAWSVGIIRGTEEMAPEVPLALRERAPVWRRGLAVAEPGPGLPMLIDPDTQSEYPHIGVFGGSGSGKSFALRVLLEEMMHSRHPGLVIDPHNEFTFASPFGPAGPYGRSLRDQHRIGTVGREIGIDFTHLRVGLLIALLEVSAGTFSEHMRNAVRVLYRERMDVSTFLERLEVARWAFDGEPADAAKVARLKKAHPDVVGLGKNAGGAETITAIARRVAWLNHSGLFSAGTDAALWAREAFLRRQVAVLRGPHRLLELVSSYVIRTLYEARRDYCDDRERGPAQKEPTPPFWVCGDEVHQFAPKNPEAPSATRGIFQTIAQEGRKYGVFLILATQRPALLNETITAQLSTKLLMRTVRSQDIETLRNETDITVEDARRLPYLQSGEGFLSLGSQGKTVPVRIRVPYTAGREHRPPWAELDEVGAALLGRDLLDGVLEQVRRQGVLQRPHLPRLVQTLSAQLRRSLTLEEVNAAITALVEAGGLVGTSGSLNWSYRLPGDPAPPGGDPAF